MVADAVAVEEPSAKLSASGIFTALTAPSFPATLDFVALAELWGLSPGAPHECRLDIANADTQDVLAESPAHRFRAQDRDGVQHSAIHRFRGLAFPGPGTYAVRVKVDGTVLGGMPLPVYQQE